jgi:hypothetical protein
MLTSLLKKTLTVLTAAWLSGCASPLFDVGQTETVLPLSRAWVDGRRVEYITTDISDAGMAQMMGANHVPRLADAVAAPGRASLLERVYKFEKGEQISIFQSGPLPTGGGNADKAYSPLWRVVMVRWLQAHKVRELRSEEQLLAAADKGELALTVTGIVVNCPVTRGADALALRGVR